MTDLGIRLFRELSGEQKNNVSMVVVLLLFCGDGGNPAYRTSAFETVIL
jgi:hypothetical protein